MNKRIISHKMNLKNYIYKFYTGYNYLTIPLLVILTILPNLLKAEGTDELCADDDNETYLFMCNDFVDQCHGGNGSRTQFAIYGCDEQDRLYFTIVNTTETVYFGFNWDDYGGGFDSGKFRIKSESGALIWGETIIQDCDFRKNIVHNNAELGAYQFLFFGNQGKTENNIFVNNLTENNSYVKGALSPNSYNKEIKVVLAK